MRKAVYTAIVGDYDDLQPIGRRTPGWDYVCFTDSDVAPGSGWTIVPVEAADDLDDTRRSRRPKILVHEAMGGYDLTIWHDASMEILCDLDEFLARRMPRRAVMSVMSHPSRDCAYDEAIKCMADRRASVEALREQMAAYDREGYPRHNGLIYGGLLVRRNTPEVGELMELWWAEVLRHSRRDQVSFNYALWKFGRERERPLALAVSPYDRSVFMNEFRRLGHPRRSWPPEAS